MRLRLPRLRVLALGGAVVASLGWVATNGLASSLVYYETPSDLLAQGPTRAGERVRLGGQVEPGTVHRAPGGVAFVVTDGAHEMAVAHQGGVPSMFQAGRGVVNEGVYGRDGVFHSDTILVKHDNVYRPPAAGRAPVGRAAPPIAGSA
jgi:cytochrome c-type biogenesis protein CcmE